MNVKGTAYLTRKDTIIKAFGEERWKSFIAGLAAKDKYFSQTIMSISLIPLDKYLLFIDDGQNEFFNNDPKYYWRLGEKSAEYSLSQGGLYHAYLLTKDIKQFVESGMPRIWSAYFDGGTFTAQLENNVAHITIAGLPTKHIFFEFLLMGYIRQALLIFGVKAVEHRVRGFSLGDNDVYYKFELKES